MGHHKNILQEHIQNFATAINSGDINRILSFYSDDCLFMPSDFGTLTKAQIGKSSSAFFQIKILRSNSMTSKSISMKIMHL